MYRLDVRNLEVVAGGQRILHGVDLSLRAGELVALLGPSGSGKSTLLRAMNGFRPGRGKVEVCGRDLYASFEALKALVGYVPQDDVVHGALTVEKALRYAAELRLPASMPEPLRRGTVDQVLAEVGLQDRRKVRIKSLSGGQRKRVAVAMELLARPPLFFLDEPTSGLDPALEEQMMALLRAITIEERLTVVTTHVLASLELVDLALVMAKGRLVYLGPPAQIAEFFGAKDLPEAYRLLAKAEPAALAERFARSPEHRRYVVERLASPPPPLPERRRSA